ncbi:MAG TPA: polysaccharide biosynthesis tyrosine autokinase [Pirellulales bacterium]|nr:polysaccharide biosynthesis tyrosine autokinase [Pirellulales bacterium]
MPAATTSSTSKLPAVIGYSGYPGHQGAGSASPTPGQGAAFSMGDARLVLRRWGWKCTATGFVLAVVAAAIVWLTFVPTYEATAFLEIKSRPIVIAFQQEDNSHVFSETQLQTIRSAVVLSRVATQPDVANSVDGRAESALSWLKKGLKAAYLGRSELCEITFRAGRPEVAALVANAIMDAYLSLHTTNVSEGTKRVVELLKEEKARRAEEVRGFQDRVRLLTKTATEDDPSLLHHEEHVIVQQNPLAGLEDKRTAAEVERAVLEAKLKVAEESQEHTSEAPPADLAAAVDDHQQIKTLKTQLAIVQSRLLEHRRRSRNPNDADAQRMEREAADLERSIQSAVESLQPKVAEDLRFRLSASRAQQIAELKTNIENQRTLEQIWFDRITDQRKKLDRLGDKSVDLDFARAELERAQDVFHRISDRIVQLQTEMSAPSRATPLKRAEPPTKPLELVPFKRLGLACLTAFLIPFGLAISWERWTRRIHDAQQLAQEVNVPVLGEISMLPTRWSAAGAAADGRYVRERMTFEESVDALRLAIMLSPEVRDLRSLAITSAVSREGKTSLASALASSLAKCTREPILLIDGDMRCPSLHEVFGTPLEPGLVDVLAGQRQVPQAIIETSGGQVHFIPAGRLTSSPHGLLQRGDFASLLKSLSSAYRYVIIDTPPVLAASEAMVIASAAEGALVCTMRDFSRGPQFRLACHRLSVAGVRLIGTVINGLPTRSWAYKYGGYGYGHERYRDYSDGSREQISKCGPTHDFTADSEGNVESA